LVALLGLTTAAQAATLTGAVTNPEHEPLPSVSVVTNVRGIGTQTDEHGAFELVVPAEVTHVTFSSVGYHSRQFKADRIPATVVLEHRYYEGGEILVTAGRAEAGVTPIAFDNVGREQIQRDYTVGEFPMLLETTPNFFAYTDGGALGYSYASIRGFDDKRISTYINGVPLNDPEDQATYFVDLPDFAANVDDIQVQRGVGNSLYGDASFGGSINVVTSALSREKSIRLSSGTGIYERTGTRSSYFHKQSVEYSSGLIEGRWHFGGRFSRQSSDGYREGAWYDGWSYYFSLARLDPNMTSELYVYGGPMQMHLAYWGASRDDIAANRYYNPLTYSNETDNFSQPHTTSTTPPGSPTAPCSTTRCTTFEAKATTNSTRTKACWPTTTSRQP
jgi:iron complex outermembrane receptor protein